MLSFSLNYYDYRIKNCFIADEYFSVQYIKSRVLFRLGDRTMET